MILYRYCCRAPFTAGVGRDTSIQHCVLECIYNCRSENCSIIWIHLKLHCIHPTKCDLIDKGDPIHRQFSSTTTKSASVLKEKHQFKDTFAQSFEREPPSTEKWEGDQSLRCSPALYIAERIKENMLAEKSFELMEWFPTREVWSEWGSNFRVHARHYMVANRCNRQFSR